MKDRIQERARQLGFDACRFTTAQPPTHADAFKRWVAAGNHGLMEYLARNAEKRTAPDLVLAGAKSIIVLAASYHRPEADQSGPVARYARYLDYHDVLAQPLKDLTAFISQLGGEGTRSLWYVDTGPLLERDLAQRAGLGFAGKHTNLISRQLGNWFFLCEIITTLALEPDPPETNHCGSCTRCLDACPTGAIQAPFQLDARRCISYLTIELKGSIPVELRPAIGTRIYGCDDCLAACPWNRFAREGGLMRPFWRGKNGGTTVGHRRGNPMDVQPLLELLDLDDAGFKRRFAGTPMLRTKRRGLLRNVCVALGNAADPLALPALLKAAQDPELLIREHALWAIDRITASTETAR